MCVCDCDCVYVLCVNPWGGGGHSTHILVGMCHGEVKNVGLWSCSSVKMQVSVAGLSMKNVGLWSGL